MRKLTKRERSILQLAKSSLLYSSDAVTASELERMEHLGLLYVDGAETRRWRVTMWGVSKAALAALKENSAR